MNSNNFLAPLSTASPGNSDGPKPRLIFELWGLPPIGSQLDSNNYACRPGGVRLAMVDIDLPDPTRFELVAGALAQGWLQNTTMIFFSADPCGERVAIARQFPGSIYAPKPIELKSLAGLFRRLFPCHQLCGR